MICSAWHRTNARCEETTATSRTPTKVRTSLTRGSVAMTCEYMGEPLLSFADGLHVDPKAGIAEYGPRSLRSAAHPKTVKVGLVGTAETIETAQSWIERSSEGV